MHMLHTVIIHHDDCFSFNHSPVDSLPWQKSERVGVCHHSPGKTGLQGRLLLPAAPGEAHAPQPWPDSSVTVKRQNQHPHGERSYNSLIYSTPIQTVPQWKQPSVHGLSLHIITCYYNKAMTGKVLFCCC